MINLYQIADFHFMTLTMKVDINIRMVNLMLKSKDTLELKGYHSKVK